MTGYYRAKRELEREEAKRYLDERDAEEALRRRVFEDNYSRDWLANYRSQPRPTRVNWSPRFGTFTTTLQGKTNGEEIIEGEFTVVADADAQGNGSGEVGILAQGEVTASEGVEAPAEAEGSFETPF